jgi:hypothetical protein
MRLAWEPRQWLSAGLSRITESMRALSAVLVGCALAIPTVAAFGQDSPERELKTFRAWLDRERPGYGCDEGPTRFRNKTVETAYPGQRLYYVLTYTRGIPSPYEKSVSLVASVDDSGRVIAYRPGSLETYRRGLIRVRSAKDAKLAAAAVLILGTCDPGERRWPYKPDLFRVKKSSKGWKCTYQHEPYYESWATFDRKGRLLEVGGSAPPVP